MPLGTPLLPRLRPPSPKPSELRAPFGHHTTTASTKPLAAAMMGGRSPIPRPMPNPSPPPSSLVQLGLPTPGKVPGCFLLKTLGFISPSALAKEVDCCVMHCCQCQGRFFIPARCCRIFLGFHLPASETAKSQACCCRKPKLVVVGFSSDSTHLLPLKLLSPKLSARQVNCRDMSDWDSESDSWSALCC